jgi:hypothetical protein
VCRGGRCGGLRVPHPQPKPAPTAASPASAPASDHTTAPGQFVASEELYLQTFNEVQQVIAALSRIIAADDYTGWLSYLTEEYVASRSSPQFLAEASQSPVLKKNGIVLRTRWTTSSSSMKLT